MGKLWGKVIKKHRIVKSLTVPCTRGEEHDALIDICHQLDIEVPIWLDKHEHEFEEFGHTDFSKDHFLDFIPFDKLQIEYWDEGEPQTRTSNDIRNQF